MTKRKGREDDDWIDEAKRFYAAGRQRGWIAKRLGVSAFRVNCAVLPEYREMRRLQVNQTRGFVGPVRRKVDASAVEPQETATTIIVFRLPRAHARQLADMMEAGGFRSRDDVARSIVMSVLDDDAAGHREKLRPDLTLVKTAVPLE
jgi:hypothetical protein